MALECIHGLDEGLCDSCYPKKVAEPAPAARAAARTAARRPAGLRTPAPTRLATKPVAPIARVDVAGQRVYHVTHIRNLAAIIATGTLEPQATPEVDVSSAITRELRRTAEVDHGVSVGEHVAFYLSPNAMTWRELSQGADGVHWSAAARAATASDFVFLVGTIGSMPGDVVLADGDAARSLTRFAIESDARTRMLGALLSDGESILDAEALVHGAVPLSAISLVSVANVKVRDEVRDAFASAGASPKIVVHPPWFVGSAE